MSSNLNAKNIVAGGAVVIGAGYITSYVWDKLARPESKAAQNELKEFKKIVATKNPDEAVLRACLVKLRDHTESPPNKLELQKSLHLFIALCKVVPVGQEPEFKYPLAIVSVTLDLLKSICRGGADALQAFTAAGGVRILFSAVTKAYEISMKGGAEHKAAKELVEKLLGVLDDIVSFDDRDVVLPFDVPKSACAAKQLADLKNVGSITMLLRPAHGFAHKLGKVLGIVCSVTSLKSGAQRIASYKEEGGASPVDQLLYLAAKSDSNRSDYARATMCIKNLIRHVPEVRARVLSTQSGVPGLSGLPQLRDQFVELIDGGGIGCPPDTQIGRPRDPTAVSAGVDALIYLLESNDSVQTTLEVLSSKNQRGLLALFGIVARCENPAVRERVATEILGPLSTLVDNEHSTGNHIHDMQTYTGTGPLAEKWGTGFRVVQELRSRQEKDMNMQKNAQRQQSRSAMQNQMLRQMMMAEAGGADPEQLEAMMGGMPPEMMHQMMMGGMQ